EQRGLAGPVGTDERVHVGGSDLKIDGVSYDQRPETLGERVHREQRLHGFTSAAMRFNSSPSSTRSTTARPRKNGQRSVATLRTSSKPIIAAAPNTGPASGPIPPNMTMISRLPERNQLLSSGLA